MTEYRIVRVCDDAHTFWWAIQEKKGRWFHYWANVEAMQYATELRAIRALEVLKGLPCK